MMTSQASIRPYLNQAYLLGLLMMAVGLTLSPFLMGMSQFWLVLVWLVDAFAVGGIKTKLSRFWQNKPAVFLALFYLMHVIGLLWTSDFQYALRTSVSSCPFWLCLLSCRVWSRLIASVSTL